MHQVAQRRGGAAAASDHLPHPCSRPHEVHGSKSHVQWLHQSSHPMVWLGGRRCVAQRPRPTGTQAPDLSPPPARDARPFALQNSERIWRQCNVQNATDRYAHNGYDGCVVCAGNAAACVPPARGRFRLNGVFARLPRRFYMSYRMGQSPGFLTSRTDVCEERDARKDPGLEGRSRCVPVRRVGRRL